MKIPKQIAGDRRDSMTGCLGFCAAGVVARYGGSPAYTVRICRQPVILYTHAVTNREFDNRILD